mgnify:CR=1 FL=1
MRSRLRSMNLVRRGPRPRRPNCWNMSTHWIWVQGHTDTNQSKMFINSLPLISRVFSPTFRKTREIRNLFTFHNMTTNEFTKKFRIFIFVSILTSKLKLFLLEFMNYSINQWDTSSFVCPDENGSPCTIDCTLVVFSLWSVSEHTNFKN